MPKISARSALSLPAGVVRIGEWRMDWGRLLLAGPHVAPVKLTPKAGAVLAALLGARGDTVARAALFDAAWPGSPSSDEVLTQVMQELRRAFGDRQRTPAWLVTVPKLGYRWEGPPAVAEPAAVAEPTPAAVVEVHAEPPRRRAMAIGAVLVLAGAVAWLVVRPPASLRPSSDAAPATASRSPDAALPIARPLLREPAREFDPDLSRDGRLLAYARADDATGVHELRLRNLDDGRERTLVRATDARLGAPKLSRRGDRLAYVRRTADACEVRVRPIAPASAGEDAAGDETILGACPPTLPTSMDWSADDAWLYLTRSAHGDAVAQRSLAVHRVRLADGKVERISDAGRWLSVDGHPRVSDDGRSVVFVRDGEGRNRVVRVAAEGGAETELLFARWPYRAAWLGDSLVLALHGSAGVELWQATGQGELVAPLARDDAGPGIAVAAGQLVFERHRADDNLHRLDLRRGTSDQISEETGSELAPRLAPDGARIAYLSNAGGDMEVHVRTLADGTRRAWTKLAPRVPLDLRWSPDGEQALLIVGTASGKQLALLQPDGTLATLSPALNALRPAQIEWHRDGDWYLTAERDGRRELLRVRAPDFARADLVVDGSVLSFALVDGVPWLRRVESDHFETVDGRRVADARADAAPADQWTANRDWLVQAIQPGAGAAGRLRIVPRAGGDVRELDIAWPEPPLGRHFDLAGDVLWLARRERVESDFYRVTLPAAD